MSSPDLATVVIVCPHCGTRYQVARATLGPSGRQVQCAHCQKSWDARPGAPLPAPIEDRLFSPAEEAVLDAALEAEADKARPPVPVPAPAERDAEHERTLAEIRAAIAPKPAPAIAGANTIDPALLRKHKLAFTTRLNRIRSTLPAARLRRGARLVALCLLIAMLAGFYLLRVGIVTSFPALAGLYRAAGLEVNVVGLEFSDATTLMSLRGGNEVMQVSAKIRSVAARTVAVPPVLVTLLDKTGASIYEWSVTSKARDMEPGEVAVFTTEVTSPPDGAVRVRLSFTNGRATEAPLAPTLAPMAH